MRKNWFLILMICVLMNSCSKNKTENVTSEERPPTELEQDTNEAQHSKTDSITQVFLENPDFIATDFDLPVGKPEASGYYNAQKFGENNHLGDDWNAVTGGNTDLGDPIYATANGYVNFAEDIGGGWGNVIRIWHQTPEGKTVESLYAHCDTILTRVGFFVARGQQIGTIGNVNGIYLAHLHFEIRSDVDLPIGAGYAIEQEGYLDPTIFVEQY